MLLIRLGAGIEVLDVLASTRDRVEHRMHVHGSCNDWVFDVAFLSVRPAGDVYNDCMDMIRREEDFEEA